MEISNAQYVNLGFDEQMIKAVIDGQESFIPICEGNKQYDEIIRQVEAGELTIQEAE